MTWFMCLTCDEDLGRLDPVRGHCANIKWTTEAEDVRSTAIEVGVAIMGGVDQVEYCDLEVVLVIKYARIQLSTYSIKTSQ